MIARVPMRLTGVLLAVAVLASCGGQPYVHNGSEFNRDSEFYRVGLKDRGSVNICYAKSETTPEKVKELAVAECGRYGRTAVFTKMTYNLCPLMTPVAASYNCFTKEELLYGRLAETGS